jgi:hypothetical protein
VAVHSVQTSEVAAGMTADRVVTDGGPREFSWFIDRVTNPTRRDFVLHPCSRLRRKEALLSVPAGDSFGRTPIGPSLSACQGVCFAPSLVNSRRLRAAVHGRRRNIVEPEGSASVFR